ncbi:hypothetical protein BP5796_03585 [Coleophoma crateriformis]|uniref:Glycoside hydrolase family 71 protein n=1 Tax=Coleophoma crateriformis TaxID=565419 RepID=A0A3D8SNY5_9HELO|nr:hypothetical protein BP5796_03585 [Coleophoma crateriformis]
MDVYASGAACYQGSSSCNGMWDYGWIWDGFKGSSAYYQVDGLPLISTFSSGGFLNSDWTEWKSSLANDMYFMPDFDETTGYYTGDDAWWYYWGDICDGIFSWESAWPMRAGKGGLYPGDVSPDRTVIQGAHSRDKYYMMGLSSGQYKNAYGTNIYRQGDQTLPARMVRILGMSLEDGPDFVQIQTWNDGPESHYIGPLWIEQNNDTQPWAYSNEQDWSHQGWQPLIKSFITAYKNGDQANAMAPPSGSVAVGAMWYKTILTESVICPNDGSSQDYYNKPDGFLNGTDALYWAVVLDPTAEPGYTLDLYSGGVKVYTAYLSSGLNSGWSPDAISAGSQMIQMKDPAGNNILAASGGLCVSDGCPDSIYNSNYQVVPFVTGTGSDSACTTTRHDRTGAEIKEYDPSAGWRSVTCDVGSLTSIFNPSDQQWADAQASVAWNDVLYEWDVDNKNAEFSNFVSDFFHGRPYPNCTGLGQANCDVSTVCGQGSSANAAVDSPAGYVILNSFFVIHNQMDYFYQGLQNAESGIIGTIGTFTSTFSPQFDESKAAKIAADMIGVVWAMSAAPLWNSWLRNVNWFKTNSNSLGTIKDTVNALVSNSVTLFKDNTEATSILNTQNTLSDFISTAVGLWVQNIEDLNSAIFDGTNTTLISTLINDGLSLDGNSATSGASTASIQTTMERALYGYLLPEAWAASTDGDLAFIATTNGVPGDGSGCDGWEPWLTSYWSTDDTGSPVLTAMTETLANANFVCNKADNSAYWLMNIIDQAPEGCRPTTLPASIGNIPCKTPRLSSLPGADKLDGTAWAGVTQEDLVAGSVATWTANGNANGGTFDLSSWDALTSIVDDGIRAPGFMNIPVCSFGEAITNMINKNEITKSANYPCN